VNGGNIYAMKIPKKSSHWVIQSEHHIQSRARKCGDHALVHHQREGKDIQNISRNIVPYAIPIHPVL